MVRAGVPFALCTSCVLRCARVQHFSCASARMCPRACSCKRLCKMVIVALCSSRFRSARWCIRLPPPVLQVPMSPAHAVSRHAQQTKVIFLSLEHRSVLLDSSLSCAPVVASAVVEGSDGPAAFCAMADGTFAIIPCATGKLALVSPERHSGRIPCLALKGRLAAASDSAGTVRVFDLAAKDCVLVVETRRVVSALAISGDYVAVALGDPGPAQVSLICLSSGGYVAHTGKLSHGVVDLHVTSDGVVAVDAISRLLVWPGGRLAEPYNMFDAARRFVRSVYNEMPETGAPW